MSDKAKQVYETMMAKDEFSRWMGVELVEIAEGACTIAMTVRQDMLNGFGILHGGLGYALADSAMAFAANSLGRVALSVDGVVHYQHPVELGTRIMAKAVVAHHSHKMVTVDVDIQNDSGQVYYRARGTFYRKSKEFENQK